jgi:hypothetical protein
MLDSDQLKVFADVNLHSAVTNDSMKLATQFVSIWDSIASAVIRLEQPFKFSCYCMGMSVVLWSASHFLDSLRNFRRKNDK